jgi:hypothetical protein
LKTLLLGVKRVILEHHGDVPILGIELVDDAIANRNVAARHGDQPRDQVERRRLPQPDGPTSATNSPCSTVKGHIIDGIDIAVILHDVFKDHLGHRNSPNA